jgi:hypothetical protein
LDGPTAGAPIVTADWVDDGMFEEAVTTASARPGEVSGSLRLARFDKGMRVHVMHLGSYEKEAGERARRAAPRLSAWAQPGAEEDHHEICLSDPNRVAPEKAGTYCASQCGWRTTP